MPFRFILWLLIVNLSFFRKAGVKIQRHDNKGDHAQDQDDLHKRSLEKYIFQSEYDGIVRSANAAYLKKTFPHASLTMVPGSEHALPIQIPELLDDAVETMLG